MPAPSLPGPHTALVVIDVQRDFLPGGALPVPDGDAILPVIRTIAADYDCVLLTGDEHPEDTAHFEQWPPHCIRGSLGAELMLQRDIHYDHVVEKGTDRESDGYSAFDGMVTFGRVTEPLDEWLRDHDIVRVDLVGLALDVCVSATAHDAVRLGYMTRVLLDATRPVRPEDAAGVVDELRARGVLVE